MITELKSHIKSFSPTESFDIIIITGNQLRHKRFAYRMINEFGEQVKYWFQLEPAKIKKKETNTLKKERKQFGEYLKKVQKFGMRNSFAYIYRRYLVKPESYGQKISEAEEKLFGAEVKHLKKNVHLEPERISIKDVNSTKFIARIQDIKPYFLLTLGGPLYKKRLIDGCRGAAINQHAGISPQMKGSGTTEWALYHRDLDLVGSTVHLLSTGADSGAIIKKSFPSLLGTDQLETIFLRVVALGTELMIDSVKEIMRHQKIRVFTQKDGVGRTYLHKQFTQEIYKSIQSDFRNFWLTREIHRKRDF
jgi:folate-dependent phosphoribosylglycinamide formyltransferase PurN